MLADITVGSPIRVGQYFRTSVTMQFDQDAPVSGYLLGTGQRAGFFYGTNSGGALGFDWLVQRLPTAAGLWLEFETYVRAERVHFTFGNNTRSALAQVFRACGRAPPTQ